MNELKDKDLREALERREAHRTRPEVPDDFCADIMQEIAPKKSHPMMWRWMAAAASVLLLIGIGTVVFNTSPTQPEQAQLSQGVVQMVDTVCSEHRNSQFQASEQSVPSIGTKSTKHRNKVGTADKSSAPVLSDSDSHHPAVVNDPNLHYAVHHLEKDTLPYQDPARVDEFIAKLADYYHVKQGELTCSQPLESNVVSSVYVFPDKATSTSPSDYPQEIDVFGKLLQVACWYKSEIPGYRLNFTNQQFFFELKDLRKQLQYRWIAERISGKILLYGTCAPIGAETSSACYQEYRDELTHTWSINTKTKEI